MKNKNRKVICIVGRTSSGKDKISKIIAENFDLDFVTSYATREMRDNEKNGREHWFITDEEADDILNNYTPLAYTKIGDIRYFSLLEDIDNDCIYIINPNGIEYLKENFSNELDIKVIYIYCDNDIRKLRASTRSDFTKAFEKRNSDEDEQFLDFESQSKWDLYIDNSGEICKNYILENVKKLLTR